MSDSRAAVTDALAILRAERARIDAILAGVAGRVKEFTPLRPAMEPWGPEIPAGR